MSVGWEARPVRPHASATGARVKPGIEIAPRCPLRHELGMSSDLPPLPDAPKPGLYRHYKGGAYRVVGLARHSETLEPLVVYQALYGDRGTWVRPAAMFVEEIEVAGRRQPRFTRVGD